ncbi:MAG: hypothetical protein JNM20_11245 [Rhizobiales bacterium]|nr:hypothetical protein [Hyphomicrobiales bacterium]
MTDREHTPPPKDKSDKDARESTVPAFLPGNREAGNEEVLRLMRAL